jgi:hypothetical protein
MIAPPVVKSSARSFVFALEVATKVTLRLEGASLYSAYGQTETLSRLRIRKAMHFTEKNHDPQPGSQLPNRASYVAANFFLSKDLFWRRLFVAKFECTTGVRALVILFWQLSL